MTHAENTDQLIVWMRRSGVFATGLASFITAKFGWHLGEDFLTSLSFAGLLALCTWITGYGLMAAYEAWCRKQWMIAGAAVVLFTVSVFCEFMAHVGAGASSRSHSMEAATHRVTSYEDGRRRVSEIERDVSRLQERLRMAPQRTAEAAQAAVDRAKADRFWKMTDGCKATKGPQTRTFCDGYASAVADVSMATERLTIQEELKIKQAELDEARKVARASGSDGQSAVAAQQAIALASIVTLSEEPGKSARFWANVGISSLLALFAIAAACLLNLIAHALGRAGGDPDASDARGGTGMAGVLIKTVENTYRDPVAVARDKYFGNVAAAAA